MGLGKATADSSRSQTREMSEFSLFYVNLPCCSRPWGIRRPPSELTFRNQFQEPKKRLALLRGHLPPDTFISGHPSFN